MKKVIFISLVFTLFVSYSGYGQEYSSAIGAKTGTGIVASYKVSPGSSNYLELVGGLDLLQGNLFVSAFYEMHKPMGNSDFRWYHGPGAGVIFESGNGNESGSTAIALGWIIGIDYAFDRVPLNFSIDAAPAIVINGNDNTQGLLNAALRYVLN
jgi:hypothetical protein